MQQVLSPSESPSSEHSNDDLGPEESKEEDDYQMAELDVENETPEEKAEREKYA